MSQPHVFQASSQTTNVTKVTGGFMQVPNSFVRSSLSPITKMVALWLGGHSTSYRFTKVSMAKALGVSRTRLDQCLAELVSAGVLQMDLIQESLPKRPQYVYHVDLGVGLAEAVSTDATQSADSVSSLATHPPGSVSSLATQNDVSVSSVTTPKKTSLLEHHLEDQGSRQAAPVGAQQKTKAATRPEKTKLTLVRDDWRDLVREDLGRSQRVLQPRFLADEYPASIEEVTEHLDLTTPW